MPPPFSESSDLYTNGTYEDVQEKDSYRCLFTAESNGDGSSASDAPIEAVNLARPEGTLIDLRVPATSSVETTNDAQSRELIDHSDAASATSTGIEDRARSKEVSADHHETPIA